MGLQLSQAAGQRQCRSVDFSAGLGESVTVSAQPLHVAGGNCVPMVLVEVMVGMVFGICRSSLL